MPTDYKNAHMNIKTLAKAKEVIKENPFMYLVSFRTVGGQDGSNIIASKNKLTLFEVYFMMNEVNDPKILIIINNIIPLT